MSSKLLEILLVFILYDELVAIAVRQCPQTPCPQQVGFYIVEVVLKSLGLTSIVLVHLSLYKTCQQYEMFFL